MPMNPEVKAKWLEALRSGEYQQGIEVLKSSGEFCCLGVLCDLSNIGSWTPDDHYRCLEGNTYVNEYFKIPQAVRDWSGFDTRLDKDKYPVKESQECVLAAMNDEGKSFLEIADWIEANL